MWLVLSVNEPVLPDVPQAGDDADGHARMGVGENGHQVFVVEADAALAVARADPVVALGAGAVDADVLEARCV